MVLSDGPLRLWPVGDIYNSLDAGTIAATLDAVCEPPGPVRSEQNCVLLDLGGRLVLIDNGMGTSAAFGPEAGRLPRSLDEAGLRAEDIDALVLTHGHPDHCWGTVRPDGTPWFPNAAVYISETELAWWDARADDGSMAARGFHAQIGPVRDRLVTVRDGQHILSGLHALATPGHTPGHLSFIIDGSDRDGSGELACLAGDVLFHHALSFAHPRAGTAYDEDREHAAATRQRLLATLAELRMRVLGYHLPWPGIGRVLPAGDAFRYVPEPMILD